MMAGVHVKPRLALPEVTVDDIRSRLSFSELCRDRLPYRNCYLEVRTTFEGRVPVVRFTALGSSKQSGSNGHSIVAEFEHKLEVHGLWFEHDSTTCCSAEGLICFMGCPLRPADNWQPVMVANPVTKEPLHELPPIFTFGLEDMFLRGAVSLPGWRWELRLTMVADPAACGQHYSVLVTSAATKPRSRSRLLHAFTAIYSSRTSTWQARILGDPGRRDEGTFIRMLALGDMVYMVFQRNHVAGLTLSFLGRNIHEELPGPDEEPHDSSQQRKELPRRLVYCHSAKMWPPATWKGVQIPHFTCGKSYVYDRWPEIELLACLGRLLIAVFPCIYEFLPSQARWEKVSTVPQDMMPADVQRVHRQVYIDPEFSLDLSECSRNYKRLFKCFEEDGLLRFVDTLTSTTAMACASSSTSAPTLGACMVRSDMLAKATVVLPSTSALPCVVQEEAVGHLPWHHSPL